MGRVTAICDMRMCYGPCDMRYANTLWAGPMQYAICEYAMGRANAICDMRIHYRRPNAKCDTRIRYAICEYTMGRANVICDMRILSGPHECDTRYANRLRTIWEYAMAAGMRYGIQ